MLKVIKHEILRFLRIWIIAIFLYIAYSFLTIDIKKEAMVILESGQISNFVLGVNLFILINFILDNFTNKRLFYYHSNLSHTNILLGKLGVVFIYSLLTAMVTLLLYNLRLYLLAKTEYLTFFRMNLDGAGFALIGKTFRECFYPFNYLLNLMFIDVLIYAMGILFHHLRKSMFVGLSLIVSIFSISIPNALIFSLLNDMAWTNKLNFNIIKKRIHVMVLRENEINFLNLFFVLVCVFISIYLIEKICRYQKENRL